MATEALSYTGINRAYSDFAGSRACEELINLRPATEGVVPVKDFSVKMANVPYRKVFIHYTTDGPKYIIARIGGADDDDVVVKYIAENGTVLGDLFVTESYGDDTFNSLNFASAGNILLISLCDKENGQYRNAAYTWKDGAYRETEADVPDVDYSVSDGGDIYGIWQGIAHIDNTSTTGECTNAVESGLNAVQEENPDICMGPILIAVAFKTSDGNTFWSGGWRMYDPVPTVNSAQDSPYVDPTSRPSEIYADFFEKYGYGYECGGTYGAYLDHIYVYGTKVTLTFPAISGWNEETSIIRSVEVYSSRPQPYLDATAAFDGLLSYGDPIQYLLVLPQKKYEEMDLGGQIMYHQASIPMASLAAGQQEVNLTFGGNMQATEDTLDTDAGALKRYGRLLSYNARFHFWDSVAQIGVGMPFFSIPPDTSSTPVEGRPYVFVRYSDQDHDELMYLGTTEDDIPLANKAKVVIAPSINIKEVIMYFQLGGVYIKRTYRMSQSTAYNYSINDDGGVETHSSTDDATLRGLINGGEKTGLQTDEPAAINVTEQYNPFVFRVEHSYLAPGNILDVQPQMAGIVDASYGRDPLNVFTERGLYALTQGSANVLYGAFLPLSQLVVNRGNGALPTEMGIFYLADGALWLVSGRRSTLVSDALHLGPHKYIRACDGYKRISGVDENYSPAPSGVTITPEYDISPALSEVSFEDFVRGVNGGPKARLSFNRFRMELLVSNPAYGYTYVLSLKYKQWFKIGRRLWQDEAGSDIACTPGATLGNIDVVDLATEEATAQVLVHMQTRPFSMGYRYIHMHRIVSMVRARLSGTAGNKLVVGLYGSDNLQDWKLLAYSKRVGRTVSNTDHPLKVSQIRTTPSARSWRYYTVCIGGPVPPDSDFGPVLVDYEPVIRRIG